MFYICYGSSGSLYSDLPFLKTLPVLDADILVSAIWLLVFDTCVTIEKNVILELLVSSVWNYNMKLMVKIGQFYNKCKSVYWYDFFTDLVKYTVYKMFFTIIISAYLYNKLRYRVLEKGL